MLPTDSTSPSWLLLTLMIVMLIASGWMFSRLTRRWTLGRKLAALRDWARSQRMQFHHNDAALPGSVARLGTNPRALLSITDSRTWIIQFQTQSPDAGQPPARWHVLVRHLGTPLPTVGLRPLKATSSLLDLLPMRTFAGMMPSERFMVVGLQRDKALTLEASRISALLPADIGLILLDDALLLDFSSRPYDGIEFSRLLMILDQITLHVPWQGGSSVA